MVQHSLSFFRSLINSLEFNLGQHESIAFLGAAQMLPILRYHLSDNLKINAIFDDNMDRIGSFLPGLPISILPLSEALSSQSPEAANLIGAVDSSGSLVIRAKSLGLTNLFTLFHHLA